MTFRHDWFETTVFLAQYSVASLLRHCFVCLQRCEARNISPCNITFMKGERNSWRHMSLIHTYTHTHTFLILKPGPKTTVNLRHCRCNHLTSFASDFFVPPNKIDWNKVSLEELLKNPLVFSVVCGIFGLYFLLLIWARRADRKDLEKVSTGV